MYITIRIIESRPMFISCNIATNVGGRIYLKVEVSISTPHNLMITKRIPWSKSYQGVCPLLVSAIVIRHVVDDEASTFTNN